MTMETTPLLRPKPAPDTTLGRWLRRTGYTLTELAEVVGVNKGTMSRIVRGGPCSKGLQARIQRATGLKKL